LFESKRTHVSDPMLRAVVDDINDADCCWLAGEQRPAVLTCATSPRWTNADQEFQQAWNRRVIRFVVGVTPPQTFQDWHYGCE
jgi:hypothetical protein